MPFQNIWGHEKQVSILQSAMARNRMPHAYLFCGMEGVGKKTTALVVAKAMNCQKGRFDACDTCPSCLKIDHRNHPDVIRIEPEGQFIRIQEIRDLQDQMKFRPFEGGKRVIILVDADKMNSIAANALLKTLEEPTRNNFLILISSRPYQLPMTILSRCQQLRFNPLNRETVFQYLQECQGHEVFPAEFNHLVYFYTREYGLYQCKQRDYAEYLNKREYERDRRAAAESEGEENGCQKGRAYHHFNVYRKPEHREEAPAVFREHASDYFRFRFRYVERNPFKFSLQCYERNDKPDKVDRPVSRMRLVESHHAAEGPCIG